MLQKAVVNDKTDCEVKSTSLRISNTTVNIKSYFYPEKELSEALFSIASTKLKEKIVVVQ